MPDDSAFLVFCCYPFQYLINGRILLVTAHFLDDSTLFLLNLVNNKILNNVKEILFIQDTCDQYFLCCWTVRQIFFSDQPELQHLLDRWMLRHVGKLLVP